MNPILKFYLIGAVISLIFQIIMILCSHRIKISQVIGYLLNITLSWSCILTLVCTAVINVLESHHWNAVLWESKAYKEMLKKEQKQRIHKA